jgi:hypothetical protein
MSTLFTKNGEKILKIKMTAGLKNSPNNQKGIVKRKKSIKLINLIKRLFRTELSVENTNHLQTKKSYNTNITKSIFMVFIF